MPIDLNKLPRHVAIIMDGNGRWAQEHGLPRVEGHRQGAKAVREVVRAAREIGLGALTLYAFSAQNWQRPPDEVATLMQLLRDYVVEERAEIMDNDIRLVAIGEVDRLPGFVKEPLDALIRDSAENRSMTLCLALSYGGRESIIAAARALSEAAAAGTLNPEQISEERFTAALQTGGLPQLDLLVRTSGEERPVELPAVGSRVRRAVLHGHVLARVRKGGPVRGAGVVPAPRAPIRAHARADSQRG
jgi:undecaprenyl diphosphate synthase